MADVIGFIKHSFAKIIKIIKLESEATENDAVYFIALDDVYKIIDNVFCVYDDDGDNFRTVSQQLDCLHLACDISFLLEEIS